MSTSQELRQELFLYNPPSRIAGWKSMGCYRQESANDARYTERGCTIGLPTPGWTIRAELSNKATGEVLLRPLTRQIQAKGGTKASSFLPSDCSGYILFINRGILSLFIKLA
jgi:hypothetical protein